MHKFDYSEIKGNIPVDIVSLVKSVTSFDAGDRYRRTLYAKEYNKIVDIAKLASAKYSNEIEGILTTDDRLVELVMRGGRPRNHTEEEIAGYGEALDTIHKNAGTMKVDGNLMKNLHRIIRAGAPEDRGRYKTRDNAIISIDSDGKRRIVFRPVPAEDTEKHMEQLFLAYEEADSEGYEPLLLIPCVILDYLCIHPFIDGNGRTSRLLTMILLYRHGIDVCRYVSMDEHIAATKGGYYGSLAESSYGWIDNKFSYFPFIRYFLRTLYECYADLDTRFAVVDGKKLNKTERIEDILSKSVAPMSKKQIRMLLPDISEGTVDAAIKSMVKSGKAEKVGTFRDARYRMKR